MLHIYQEENFKKQKKTRKYKSEKNLDYMYNNISLEKFVKDIWNPACILNLISKKESFENIQDRIVEQVFVIQTNEKC